MLQEKNFSNLKYFLPDIFSIEGPVYHTLTDERRQLIVDGLVNHYFNTIPQEIDVYSVGGNEINSKNFRINADSSQFVAKKSTEKDGRRLNSIARLHETLIASKLLVPKIIRSKRDEMCIYDGQDYWLLMEYIAGKYFDGKSLSQLFNVAVCFNELQQALHHVDPALAPQSWIEILLGDESELWDELKAKKTDWSDYFGAKASETLFENFNLLENTIKESGFLDFQCDPAESYLTHIDWHPYNILIDDMDSVWILDIDSINLMHRSIASAFGAYKILRQFAVANRDATNHILTEGVCGYCERLTLSNQMKRESFIRYASIEILRRIFIILRLTFKKDNRDWNHVLPMHLAALQESKILFNRLPR